MRYVRFGEIPPEERSINFRKMSLDDNSDFTWECEHYGAELAYSRVKEKDFEAGVSVFAADENGNVIADTDILKSDLEFRLKEKCVAYLVEGEEVGKGVDGEPLIKNIKIIKKL